MEEVFPYLVIQLDVDTHDCSVCVVSFVSGPIVIRVASLRGCFDSKIWDLPMDAGLKHVMLIPREEVAVDLVAKLERKTQQT